MAPVHPIFLSHRPESHASVPALPGHPYANTEQNGEFKSATVCLVPPALVPAGRAEPASLSPQNGPTAEQALEAEDGQGPSEDVCKGKDGDS